MAISLQDPTQEQTSSAGKSTPRTRLGFIGLGYLGSRIARRLAAARFPMVVYDLDHAKAAELAALGAEIALHPGKLASKVDVVLSCLPDEAAVEAVYLGTGNVLRSAKRGARIIELSTISPEAARHIHRAAWQFGLSALDVAVSGSTASAEAGTLTLFGGGAREVFEAAEPMFSAIAKQWFYMGPSGSGMAMKLVVNALLGVGMQAIAEAIALGSRLDLPRDLLLDTLAKTAVVAPAHAGKLASAKKQDYAPQFPVRLMRKDFGLVLAAVAQLGLWMPVTEAAAEVNSAEAASGIEEDFSAVIRRMERLAQVTNAWPPAA
ncbi:MAG: 3-hydroxyisobutyrate dehydrogenase [Bryobacterales bacterium]|jgi:3-hydroxyisobutyrate dehydrogenase-like beta-hydroxyacid dehydrogenase|nr:3-hydroxyisobutyrate dehydrogenase [Bryobacterales bacterium]